MSLLMYLPTKAQAEYIYTLLGGKNLKKHRGTCAKNKRNRKK